MMLTLMMTGKLKQNQERAHLLNQHCYPAKYLSRNTVSEHTCILQRGCEGGGGGGSFSVKT